MQVIGQRSETHVFLLKLLPHLIGENMTLLSATVYHFYKILVLEELVSGRHSRLFFPICSNKKYCSPKLSLLITVTVGLRLQDARSLTAVSGLAHLYGQLLS